MRFSDIFSGKFPFAFLLATLGIAFCGEAIIQLIGLAPGHWAIPVLLVVGIVMLAAAWFTLSLWKRDLDQRILNITGESAAPAAGLCLAASPGDRGTELARTLIKHHGQSKDLQHVMVVHTTDTKGTAAYESIIRVALEFKITADHVHAICVKPEDIDNPNVIVKKLQEALDNVREQYSLDEGQVAFDYTGGTAACTAAMVLLGAVPGRRLTYVLPKERDENGRPVLEAGSKVVEVDLNFKVAEVRQRLHLPLFSSTPDSSQQDAEAGTDPDATADPQVHPVQEQDHGQQSCHRSRRP